MDYYYYYYYYYKQLSELIVTFTLFLKGQLPLLIQIKQQTYTM